MVIRILSSTAIIAIIGIGLCVSWFLVQNPTLPATGNPFNQIANMVGKIASPLGAILFLTLSKSAFNDVRKVKRTIPVDARGLMQARNFAWVTLVLGVMYVVYALGAHGVLALLT